LEGSQIIVFACTSQTMRSVAQLVKSHVKCTSAVPAGRAAELSAENPVLVSAAKGLELASFQRMSQILSETLPSLPVCSLSGPNLAIEVLKGLPTAAVVACQDKEVAKYVQTQLTVPSLRMYSNDDIIGVELGGSFKNVIAIAAGGVDGLALGANAKAALITRGLAEMTRIAVALGAKASTMVLLVWAISSPPAPANCRAIID
jgi:glycerol-3-phosphate dehydrogenase (NAD(P)+)